MVEEPHRRLEQTDPSSSLYFQNHRGEAQSVSLSSPCNLNEWPLSSTRWPSKDSTPTHKEMNQKNHDFSTNNAPFLDYCYGMRKKKLSDWRKYLILRVGLAVPETLTSSASNSFFLRRRKKEKGKVKIHPKHTIKTSEVSKIAVYHSITHFLKQYRFHRIFSNPAAELQCQPLRWSTNILILMVK